jgi:two-component system OmpR family response regulator
MERRAKRVLVVDDDPDMRRAINEVLVDQGLRVDLAGDGREALDRARGAAPALVILDITLPIVDGFTVADELRQRFGVLPILAITADGRAPQKARRVGAYAYLRKPFELDDLLATVARGLGRSPDAAE